MRTSTKLIRLCAVIPAAIAGTFIAIMALGFLPDVGVLAALVGTLVVSLVLAAGRWEAAFARIFGFARGLRPGERGALDAPLEELRLRGLEPGRVLVRLTDTGGLPAAWIGRSTVIVEPTLIEGLYENRLTREDAECAIGHAVASQRVGPARFDLAARLWAFPWTILHAIVRQIAYAFSWVPASGFAWSMRFVIGVIVLVQAFQPGGNKAIGIAASVLIAVSYVAPAADRYWRRAVIRRADELVTHAGLAGSLVYYVKSMDPDPMERVHRIKGAYEECQRREEDTARPTEPAGAGALVLIHPTALR